MLSRRVDSGHADADSAKLSAILNLLPQCVKIVSLDGVLTDVNEAGLRMLGASRVEDVRGTRLHDLAHPDDRLRFATQHARAVEGRPTEPIIIRAFLADGEERALNCRCVCLRDGKGRPSSIICITEDVTDSIATEREVTELRSELERLGRISLLSEIAGALEHELSQPITAISNYLGIALGQCGPDALPKKQRESIELAAQQSRRAVEILRSIRELTSASPAEADDVDLTETLKSARALALHDLKFANLDLELTLPDTPAVVHACRASLQQAVVNLIRNSVDSIGRGPDSGNGRIAISLECSDGRAVISVEDNGRGVDPEIKPRLFEPFATNKLHGSGIGLSISRRLLRAHGGDIEFVDRPDGKRGAIFAITLPLATVSVETGLTPESA